MAFLCHLSADAFKAIYNICLQLKQKNISKAGREQNLFSLLEAFQDPTCELCGLVLVCMTPLSEI